MHRNQLIGNIAGLAIRWGGAALIVKFGADAVMALAGHTTLADIAIKVFGGLKINTAVAWVLGAGGVVYGRREKTLRLKINDRLGNRVKELEQKIDRRRTSSQLTKSGRTPPNDVI